MSVALSVFREMVSKKLEVICEEGTIELDVVDLVEKQTIEGFELFTLQLRGPLEFFLPQETYLFQNQWLQKEPMFMVPVGQGPEGYTYEITFHRSKLE